MKSKLYFVVSPKCYVEQTLGFKFLSSKEAGDWLAEQRAEQRKNVEEGEQSLQRYRVEETETAREDGPSGPGRVSGIRGRNESAARRNSLF